MNAGLDFKAAVFVDLLKVQWQLVKIENISVLCSF